MKDRCEAQLSVPMRRYLLRYGTALALSALAVIGLVGPKGFAQEASKPGNPFANNPGAAGQGGQLFNSTCAVCHGTGAVGGRGPSLRTGHFAHGDSDAEIFQTIKGGVKGTEMPSFSALPDADVWRLVTYIKSLSATAGADVAVGDATRGQSLFFGSGNCTACHEINGKGSDFAPDLSAEGKEALGAIRTGILHAARPRGPRAPGARFVEVVLKNGQHISGIARAQDSFALDLEQKDGTVALIDASDIASETAQQPSTPANTLSPTDVADLVAYLSHQKARNFQETEKVNPPPVLPYERLAHAKAEPQNWVTYWGGYKGHHFSELTQINAGNVANLSAKWATPLLGDSVLETTPLVVDGIMYVSGSPGEVYALDARNGMQIWSFKRKQDIKNPYEINPFNRGVAVLDGRVFVGTLDDNLIALDAHTGRELWEKRIADPTLAYTITGAPLALKDKIVVGVAAGESGTRPWLEAFDPKNGTSLWRFNLVPGPGEKGVETWAGDSWKTGGVAAWLTGSYDQDTNTVIVGTGNPVPDFNPYLRKGDNLYSDSVLGLDANTGKLKWYYQFTPNDSHDWDSTEDMVLADQVVDGKNRKLVMHADRNGFFYVLDRTNGKFLFAKPFVRQTWNLGFTKKGRPIINPKSLPTPEGVPLFPAVGGTNFQAPSYDDQSKLLYLAYGDSRGFASNGPAVNEPGREFLGRGTVTPPPGPPPEQGIMAIDTTTGAVRWKYPLTRASLKAGVVATRGGVVFAATGEGRFIALDAVTGKPLWNFRAGEPMTASPISYSVDGVQYIAVASGNTVFGFALPTKQ